MYSSSFSKTIAPGLRVGYAIIPEALAEELEDREAARVYLQRCDYLDADALQAAGDLDGALAAFLRLGSYEDAPERANQCRYAQAEAAAARGEYESAEAQFKAISGYADSAVRAMDMRYARAEALLGAEFVAGLIHESHIVPEPMNKIAGVLDKRDLENDYVRVKTLELCCRRLESVPGAAAELGVYRGGFARCINALLPGRKLYLFDTFEGFESSEAAREMHTGHLSAGVEAAHKNTSLNKVMSLMPHPGSVQPMPGFFPDSLNGLEDSFALVSLDADLEESTLAGLEYFVPRMVKGGYIFLHDYDSHSFHGVRKALERYESNHGVKFCALPLCDVNGTLVLCM
jgi:tetratricopeptide (TPR) repeat protein